MNIKSSNSLKIGIILFLIISCMITFINPLYPDEMFLQHLGTLCLGFILVLDVKKNYLEVNSFVGISIFVFLHIVSARYIYSYVPYNEWFINLTGFDLHKYMNWERNHFDRFVHFSFGVLFYPFLFQNFKKWNGLKNIQVIFVAWLALQTFSMLYELFEWSLTLVMSWEDAENYNGQQGDNWDAHKDMALAMLGSSFSSIYFFFKKE